MIVPDNTLKISLIQFDIAWEKPAVNRDKVLKLLTEVPVGTDLVVLPEMFTTGFSMESAKLAEPMDGETVSWMVTIARSFGFTLAGTIIISEEEQCYNRLLFIRPDGSIDYYDKRHLFSIGLEDQSFAPGKIRKVFNLKGFRILPQICYDLRFPVFARNRNDYDIYLNCANWPASRREVWQCLLNARAIENQAYVIGVNRIGSDDEGINYCGDSQIIDAKGQALGQLRDSESVISVSISMNELLQFRSKFPVLPDGDDFSLVL